MNNKLPLLKKSKVKKKLSIFFTLRLMSSFPVSIGSSHSLKMSLPKCFSTRAFAAFCITRFILITTVARTPGNCVDSFECDARKLRRGVRAAQPDSDSTQSTLCESSMVTRIRNRMRKGRLGLGMYLSIPTTKLKYNYII